MPESGLPRKLFWVASVIGLLIFFVFIGVRWVQNYTLEAFSQDATQVIAMTLTQRLAENGEVSQAEIDAAIKQLGDASVIHVGIGNNGRPTDPYGNPFQVTSEIADGVASVTVTCAGRDGRLATSDDISYADRKSVDLKRQ